MMIRFMMKILLVVWVALLPLLGTQVAELPQVAKPEGIYVGDDLFYVLEGTTIHMYKMNGFEYVGKFGKQGEGPSEIKKNPYGGPIVVIPFQGKIYVTSMAKLSIFSKMGEFIQEFKVDPNDNFYPFVDSFICMAPYNAAETGGKTLYSIFLADKELKKGKPLYISDFEVGQNFKFDFPLTPFYPDMTEDKLFIIAGKDGFAIDAFDRQGNKLYRIEKKEPSIPVPDTYQQETEKAFKRNPQFAGAWDFFKQRISYKKNFPSIYGFFNDEGKLYVLTNKMNGEERECVVMDHKGKELKRLFLPIPMQYGFDFSSIFTAKGGLFYYLGEAEDGETWTLHTLSLK